MAKKIVYVMGYQPREGILPDDYRDFKPGTAFSFEEASAMSEQGNFPPGIILQIHGGPPCVVRGNYGSQQTAEILQP